MSIRTAAVLFCSRRACDLWPRVLDASALCPVSDSVERQVLAVLVEPPPGQHRLEITAELLELQTLGDCAAGCCRCVVDHLACRRVVAGPEGPFEVERGGRCRAQRHR